MMARLIRILFGVSVVLLPARWSFGQDVDVFKQQALSSVSADPGKTSPAANGVPNIGDLLTVVDKATAGKAESRDWSTPVKLVIIFTGLALVPSLLVMMT